MYGKLVFVGGGSKRQPRGGADRERLVEARRQCRENGRIVRGGGGRVNPKECNRTVGVDFGSEGEGEGIFREVKNLSGDVWEGGRDGVAFRIGGVGLSGRIEPSGGRREGGGLRGGGGGGRCGNGGDPSGRGLLGFPTGGGSRRLRVGAPGANRVKVARDELGDTGVAPVGKVGGFPGGGMRLGKGFGVSVTDVVDGVHPGEVRVESGAIVRRRGRGEGPLGWL